MKTQNWYTIKKLIPRFIYNDLINFFYKIRHLIYSGNLVECPCCGLKHRKFYPSGKYGTCPGCGASARHRNLFYFLENEKLILKTKKQKILHFAPENGSITFFSKLSNCEYLSADLNSPRAKLKIDMTQISFDDNFFDVVLSSHVLEHVSNDRKAMSELFRILKPGGYSVHQVPIDYTKEKTFEDETINTNKLRDKYYGHPDHKRIYGKDYKNRLLSAGFNVSDLEYIQELPIDIIKKFGLNPNEIIYYCTK